MCQNHLKKLKKNGLITLFNLDFILGLIFNLIINKYKKNTLSIKITELRICFLTFQNKATPFRNRINNQYPYGKIG
jgi:hypothetical protein